MKKYKIGIVLGIMAIILSLFICGINGKVLGWLFGFTIGLIGLILTVINKEKYNIKLSLILNIVGIVFSILNLMLGLMMRIKV